MSPPLFFPDSATEGILRGEGMAGREARPLVSHRIGMPPILRACYYAPFQKHAINPALDLWPEGYNQCHPLAVNELVNLKRGGMFLLAELAAGGYLAMLPLVSSALMAWLRADKDGLLVEADHWGSAGLCTSGVPLVAWARTDDPYTCALRVWEMAAALPELAGHIGLRRTKAYPEPLAYLGWCTWEEFKWRIDEATLTDAIRSLASAPVPVRWILIDDGHIDEESSLPQKPTEDAGEVPPDEDARKLAGLGTNFRRFPHGWSPVIEAVHRSGFRWAGVWLNFNGYWGGIAKANRLGVLNDHLLEVRPGTLQPRPDLPSAPAFYDALIRTQKEAGFDFVKVDNQAKNLTFYQSVVPNAVTASSCNHRALEDAVQQHLRGMINCMAHNNLCAFHTTHSPVTRCSEDYKKGDLWRAKHHLNNSFANMVWMRATAWGDHDMFHSDDPVAGAVMARSKAVSGGPVYLSDSPAKIRPELVLPLCYADGRILRPLEPAVPAPESLFLDSYESPRAFRVLAPLTAHASAVIAYNITSPEIPVEGFVAATDHAHARRLAGGPSTSACNMVVFRWNDRSATALGPSDSFSFQIPGFGDELFWLAEEHFGWAVLGRSDKYIGPAAVTELCFHPDAVRFHLEEPGSVLVWLDAGRPVSRFPVEPIADRLWSVQVGANDTPVVIRRSPGLPRAQDCMEPGMKAVGS